MVYQQCGQACPETCDSDKNEVCVGGCVEGCFCPNGKVLWNGNCINATECAGTNIHTCLNASYNLLKYSILIILYI